MPASLADATAGYSWHRDLVGESGGAVYRLDAPDRPALYLKHDPGDCADPVAGELARLLWLRDHLDVPACHGFVLDSTGAWLLTAALPGVTAFQWLSAGPDRGPALVDLLAGHLRRLHAIPVDACPFAAGPAHRLAAARRRVEAGLVDEDDFADARRGWSAEAVWQAAAALLPEEPELVVTHGDYSLDNMLVADGAVTGCLDLGRVGVADRYQDLAILSACLADHDPALVTRLFARYGIAVPDERRLAFHLLLDDLF